MRTPTKSQINVHIRWMIRDDMVQVLQAEEQSFEYPWTEEDFLRCLRQPNCIGMVAEQYVENNLWSVAGYMIYELRETKIHIINFAVALTHRRRGVGKQMANKLINKLQSHRRTQITLAVRETNLTAQIFFRSMAFRAIKVLPHYYEDSGEDAFLMEYRIPST